MASVRTVRSLLAVALFGAIILSLLVLIKKLLMATGKRGRGRGWRKQWGGVKGVQLPRQPVVEPQDDDDDDDDSDDDDSDDDDSDDGDSDEDDDAAPMPPATPVAASMPPGGAPAAPPPTFPPEPMPSMDNIDQFDVPEFASSLR